MMRKTSFALLTVCVIISLWGILPAQATAAGTGPATGAQPDAIHNDALTAPDMPDLLMAAASGSARPGYYQTSDFMAGSVAVGVVLLESNGATDPSTEDWTSDQQQRILSEINAALAWWAAREPRARLSFVIDDHATTPLPTSVEPITRPQSDERLWVGDAMSALGYTAVSYFSRVRDYNNALRVKHHTDWAFTIFVVNDAHDGDHAFSNDYFAYAYVGGPFMVMTYNNATYGPENMDAVTAHEMGHIFFALDQYAAAGQACATRSGYLSVENQNSQAGGCASNVDSIMRGQIAPYTRGALDPFAAGQIGWRVSGDDGLLDSLRAELPISITQFVQTGNRVAVSGTIELLPYASPSRPSVTINTLTGIQYRLGDGEWHSLPLDDDGAAGASDRLTATFHLATDVITPGLHTLQVAARDSAGNVSSQVATRTVAILDPVDGGLITAFDSSAPKVHASQQLDVTGVAYQLESGVVKNVQYRVNGGDWRSAAAQDGKFDGRQEAFTIALDSLDKGAYLIEARATDSTGKTETTLASLNVIVKPVYTVFLPAVMR